MNAAQHQVAVVFFWAKLMSLSHKPACRLPVNYTHHCYLLIVSPKADTHFIVSQRVEG